MLSSPQIGVIPVVGPVLNSVLLSLSSSSEGEHSDQSTVECITITNSSLESVNNNNNRFYMMAVHIRGYVHRVQAHKLISSNTHSPIGTLMHVCRLCYTVCKY